jgi:NAD-dependent dihydropyrimidine dehydrogenase PreA subunit
VSSYRQIIVVGSPIGLHGLDEAFAARRAAGRKPGDAGLGLEIVEQMRRENYIPQGARDLFAAAFEREYAAYLTQMESGGSPRQRGYGMWRGYPREAIPWFPSVNEDECNGCGVCLKLCSTHCLVLTEEGKIRVDDPFACVVGCSSCANICKPKAITFPPRSMLEAYKPR